MYDEQHELPKGVCPKCGDVQYDLDVRRGDKIYCHCGARLIISYPVDERPPRLPD